MKRPKTLSPAFVKGVTQLGRYGDGRGGHGLSLVVRPTKIKGRLSKNWVQRIRIHGRETNLGLGSYPAVTLAEARLLVAAGAWPPAPTASNQDRQGSDGRVDNITDSCLTRFRSAALIARRSGDLWPGTAAAVGRRRVGWFTSGLRCLLVSRPGPGSERRKSATRLRPGPVQRPTGRRAVPAL